MYWLYNRVLYVMTFSLSLAEFLLNDLSSLKMYLVLNSGLIGCREMYSMFYHC